MLVINVYGVPSDSISSSSQSHFPHAKILLLRSGSGSVSWRCFSCCHLPMPPLHRGAAGSKAWVTGDTQEPFPTLFHLFLRIISTTAVSWKLPCKLLGKLTHVFKPVENHPWHKGNQGWIYTERKRIHKERSSSIGEAYRPHRVQKSPA